MELCSTKIKINRANINEKVPFKALPQIAARLEEKVDALTETVDKQFQGLTIQAAPQQEEMVTIQSVSTTLYLSVSGVCALVQQRRIPCYKSGQNLLFLPLELRNWLTTNHRTGQQSIEEQLEELSKDMRRSARGRK